MKFHGTFEFVTPKFPLGWGGSKLFWVRMSPRSIRIWRAKFWSLSDGRVEKGGTDGTDTQTHKGTLQLYIVDNCLQCFHRGDVNNISQ